MTQYPRYAVYFVPSAETPLYRFGAGVLGYDAFTGDHLLFADNLANDFDDWDKLTEDPRKYGFHATLKAPLSLASGRSEDELAAAIKAFAEIPRVIPAISPVVRTIGSFIAIVQKEPSPALQNLAEDCTAAFDTFRAPLTEHDRARRNVSALTQRQTAHLDRWGYPYVFEDFRFHMTLTGPISPDRRASVLEVLQRRFATLKLQTLAIDEIALLRQNDTTSNFKVMSHRQLAGNG